MPAQDALEVTALGHADRPTRNVDAQHRRRWIHEEGHERTLGGVVREGYLLDREAEQFMLHIQRTLV
jgi:hypothetical protein